jgi:MoCo/4Fe-4S cofactor protein with predicted Tat translocation signal
MKKDNSNNVWIGELDLKRDPEFMENASNEFKDTPLFEMLGEEGVLSNQKSNRRDFLKFLGFGVGAAVVAAGCEIPVKKAIPYVIRPEEIVPGLATYYASSFVRSGDYCSILVKTRDGRPIKIEGNDSSEVTFGGTSARAQAEVLNLYNTNRNKSPLKKDGDAFKPISWKELDEEVIKGLKSGGGIRLVSHTNMSPSSRKLHSEFAASFTDARFVYYDPISYAAALRANELTLGQRALPEYKFEEADMIVSFNADFLGTWGSPIENAHRFMKNRKLDDPKTAKMSRLIQFESHMSLTGSNADNRVLVKPSEQSAAAVALYNKVASLKGAGKIQALPLNEKAKKAIDKLGADLVKTEGRSIVLSGNNFVGEQIIVNAINQLLGNFNKTIDFTHANLTRQGDESGLVALVKEMEAGKVSTIVFLDCNPVYDYAGRETFSEALKKVKSRVSTAYSIDETAMFCDLVAPNHHMMESWGDVQPKRGHYSLIQPVISPLFDTRQAETSLLFWAGKAQGTKEEVYFNYLKTNWTNMIPGDFLPGQTFDNRWNQLLKEGVVKASVPQISVTFKGNVNEAASTLPKTGKTAIEISLYETVNIGNGQYAENPWLQEMPNPVDRTVWGNHLAIPISFDGVNRYESLNDLKDGDIVTVEMNGQKLEVPVVRAFGQMEGTVALALGYGRSKAGMVGTGIGVDANSLLSFKDDLTIYFGEQVSVSEKIAKDKDFASVQYHHTMGLKAADGTTGEQINADERELVDDFWKNFTSGFQGALTERSIIYQSNLKELDDKTKKLIEKRAKFKKLNDAQIYNGYDENYALGHHWAMHIDLNACTGCGACTIACMAENNIPVVGKHEVHRHHEMAWLRIDRYFYGDFENPNVVYQPMLCQHCDNAPCENVCPVNATNHSQEGLNQMAYNRCIGTRYCANNCPYKVRRFNWLDYTTADIMKGNEPALHLGNKEYNDESLVFGSDNLTRMVLNPDVTVRSRGVIEKCSFCVQRLQEGKLNAKREERKLVDRDVRTACQMACATNAISFGDRNDEESVVTKKMNSPLSYYVLEEVNVRSSISYSMKVNNRDTELNA